MPADDLPNDETLRALYRRLPDDEVPSHLDATIRAAASREMAKVRQPWWRHLRWQVPLAAMATASITLVLLRGPLRDEVQSTVLRAERAAPAAEEVDVLAQAPADPLVEEDACTTDAPAAPPPPPSTGIAAEPPAPAAAPVSATAAPGPSAPMRQRGVALGFANGEREGAARSKAAEELRFGRSYYDEAPPAMEWPFGLTPDMQPEDACAQIALERLTACSARRAPQGELVLVLTGDENSLRRQIVGLLDAAGWKAGGVDERGVRQVFLDTAELNQVVLARSGGGLRLEFSQR